MEQAHDGSDLRHSLDDHDGGHDGSIREVSDEERLVDRHVFDADDLSVSINFNDTINQQKLLDDAHTSKPELNYGGMVAGPIFARVAEKAARYLDLEPHEEPGKGESGGRIALTNSPRR